MELFWLEPTSFLVNNHFDFILYSQAQFLLYWKSGKEETWIAHVVFILSQ